VLSVLLLFAPFTFDYCVVCSSFIEKRVNKRRKDNTVVKSKKRKKKKKRQHNSQK
jgi:hypothetical protein